MTGRFRNALTDNLRQFSHRRFVVEDILSQTTCGGRHTLTDDLQLQKCSHRGPAVLPEGVWPDPVAFATIAFAIAIAASEVAIGLAIFLAMYGKHESITLDDFNVLRN